MAKPKYYEVRVRVTLEGAVVVEANSPEEAHGAAEDYIDRDFYENAEMVDWKAERATPIED